MLLAAVLVLGYGSVPQTLAAISVPYTESAAQITPDPLNQAHVTV